MGEQKTTPDVWRDVEGLGLQEWAGVDLHDITTNGLFALAYARAGLRVFPLRPGTKMPATAHGHKDATTDPGTITRWWARADLGVAIRPDPCMVVIDIDSREGASYEGLQELVGPLPPTLTAASGRGDGGVHLYFLAPPIRYPGKIGAAKGYDLKTANGYLVAPPTRHPDTGQPYVWLRSCGPVPLPAAALGVILGGESEHSFIRTPKNANERMFSATAPGGPGGLLEWFAKAEEGERNTRLNRAVYALHGEGRFTPEVEAEVRGIAVSLGLGANEIEATIRSATKGAA